MIMNVLNTMPHFMYMYVWEVRLVSPCPPPSAPSPSTLTNEPMKKTYESQREKKKEKKERKKKRKKEKKKGKKKRKKKREEKTGKEI